MTDKKPFSGDSFSSEDFTPEERAAHREMHHKVSDVWPSVQAISDLVKGGRALRAIILWAGVIGAAVAYLVKQGVF